MSKYEFREMYICNCNGVREKEIQKVIHNGVKTWKQILAHFDYVPCCGRCEDEINCMIEDHSPSSKNISLEEITIR